MVASGNDFVIMEEGYPLFARRICNRKYGVGADGLLVLGKSKVADVKMRIFNADGSEAQMCGNGARCVALYISKGKIRNPEVDIETKAGIIRAKVTADNVKIRLTDPTAIKLNMPLKINRRALKVNFINTGVPHTVIFVEGLERIDVVNLGRQLRWHNKFRPAGTNVDFVGIINNSTIKVRTYERGVEDETLACGTGAVASALITNCQLPVTNYRRINVHTQGGEILRVYFDREKDKFTNVWLEGKAGIVYKGAYYV